MKFLLDLYLPFSSDKIDIRINSVENEAIPGRSTLEINYLKENGFAEYSSKRYLALFLGDLVIPAGIPQQKYFEKYFNEFAVNSLQDFKGHFYLILIDRLKNNIQLFNSLFSILPLYNVNPSPERIIISSSIGRIRERYNRFTLSRKYILERLLFNYSFGSETLFSEISLVPSNSFISIDNRFEIKKHLSIENYFCGNHSGSPDDAADAFISNAEEYFPASSFYMTLTGGFDSRTITALAHKRGKNFTTFSYGESWDKNIEIPAYICRKLNLSYKPFILDEVYSEKYYINSVESAVSKTDGNASFSRSHYAYIAGEIGEETDYLLSGNFGSEILRTMKVPGVMTSGFLFKLFSTEDENLLWKEMTTHPDLEYLVKERFTEELEKLFEEIRQYKRELPKDLNLNQKFYIYMFEEVFRKYFGPEITIQNQYGILNRTPFLDFDFLKSLLTTGLAGVHGRFRETNPLLRFKGQILYAIIMKKLDSPLLNFRTEKGYKPSDFLSPFGRINIAYNYARKYFKKADISRTSYNELCFKNNKAYFNLINIPSDIFNTAKIKDSDFSDSLAHVISMILYLEMNDNVKAGSLKDQ